MVQATAAAEGVAAAPPPAQSASSYMWVVLVAVMMIIAAGSTLSAFGLSLIGPGVPAVVLWLLLITTGLSAVGWNGINMTFVAELAGRSASATAAGFNLTGSYVGILIGPPLFGLLVDASGSYL